MKAVMRFALLVMLSPGSAGWAQAAGVNLAWSACMSEGGVANRDFTCSTNSSSHVMYASFILSADQSKCIGIEATVEITAAADSLPNWWQLFNTNSCRRSGLSASFDFSSDPGTPCADMWSGQGMGGLAAYQTFWTSPQVPSGLPNQARIRLGAAVPPTAPLHLIAGTEYYAFKLIVSSAKTVGADACDGCQTPVCLLLSEINVVQSDNQHEDLTQAATSNLITWQSATSCPAGMAPQNVTWGQIRSILH